jgi:hypothetical protein
LRTWVIGSIAAWGASFLLVSASPSAARDRLNPAGRCLAMVGYAEAVSEGQQGMAAVMRVVHNRTRDPRFPQHPCKVVAQDGQFQAIEESRKLKWTARRPQKSSLEWALGADTAYERKMLALARRLATDPRVVRGRDPTGGALYFVNPDMMDPSRCPWFAKLRRTTQIGSHVFMRHYKPGERRGPPALDCRDVGRGYLVARNGDKLPAPAANTGSRSATGTEIPVPAPRPAERRTVLASNQ